MTSVPYGRWKLWASVAPQGRIATSYRVSRTVFQFVSARRYGRPAIDVGDESRVAVDHVVEPNAVGLLALREKDDLAGVHGEVFDDVIDRLEHGHLVRLDRAARVQVGRRQRGEHVIDLADRLLEPVNETRRWQRRPLIELTLPVTHVLRATDPADDPLPRVTGEVEHQVADAVRRVVRPGPDDVVVEHGHREADLRQ